jgi:magnesium transporter
MPVSYHNTAWIHLVKPTEAAVRELVTHYRLAPLPVAELAKPTFLPKVLEYQGCLYFATHIPYVDPHTGDTNPVEVDFILTPEALITVTYTHMPEVQDMYHRLEQSRADCMQALSHGPTALMLSILEELYNICLRKLEIISTKIDVAEAAVFGGDEEKMVREISVLKRDILNFRRTMRPERSVLESLANATHELINAEDQIRATHLYGLINRIWLLLESEKESIEALEETNNSLLENKLDQTMKVFTVFSAVILPVTAYASLMAISTGIPFGNVPYGFWIHLGIVILIGIMTYCVFRFKRWI